MSLIITSTPQGRFVYWKGFEPAELLDDPRLIAYIPDLPFQHGRPLSPIEEVAETVLVDYNTSHDEHSTKQHSSWLPSEMSTKTSTLANYLTTSPPTSSQQTPLKKKMRSAEGRGGEECQTHSMQAECRGLCLTSRTP